MCTRSGARRSKTNIKPIHETTIFSCPRRRASTKPVGPASLADAQLRAGMCLAQLRKDPLQGVQIIGDAAVRARFPAPAFGERDGDGLRVDTESGEQQ